MRLIDLLQLTNDLNEQTNLFMTINKNMLPLTKLKIISNECILFTGKVPMTKAKLRSVVKNLHGRNIPLYVQNKQEKIPVYGIQILPERNAIRLT